LLDLMKQLRVTGGKEERLERLQQQFDAAGSLGAKLDAERGRLHGKQAIESLDFAEHVMEASSPLIQASTLAMARVRAELELPGEDSAQFQRLEAAHANRMREIMLAMAKVVKAAAQRLIAAQEAAANDAGPKSE
jgi:hypothetical protein